MELSRAPALTVLECLALELSATGMLTDEMADHLNIGPDEVRWHVAGAMAALGASSKLEAVALALRQGLIELPAA